MYAGCVLLRYTIETQQYIALHEKCYCKYVLIAENGKCFFIVKFNLHSCGGKIEKIMANVA